MEKTIVIEGMMCPNCSKHVHDALCTLRGMEHAEVNHASGTAVCTMQEAIADDVLTKAVTDAGYRVVEIR